MVDVPLMIHKPPQRGAPRQLDIAAGCMRVGRRRCCCCCHSRWRNPNKIFGNFCFSKLLGSHSLCPWTPQKGKNGFPQHSDKRAGYSPHHAPWDGFLALLWCCRGHSVTAAAGWLCRRRSPSWCRCPSHPLRGSRMGSSSWHRGLLSKSTEFHCRSWKKWGEKWGLSSQLSALTTEPQT